MPLAIVFTNPGNYTIEDDGIRGNNISVIRDGSGTIIQTFVHPSDTLTFSTITPGVNLTFNVGDSFGTADVSVGILSDLAASPDSIVVRAMRSDDSITLVSRGAITEGGSDASADVIAGELVLSAVSGIGTPTNVLETQTTFIEAETDTGGINLANYGQVGIGGITPDVAGLDVADSGNINFSTVGTIFLTDTSGEASVHGGDLSGNVTLTALGAFADIYAPGDFPAVYARGGGITLNAGRDVLLGPGGTEFNNDILATGDIRITAGGDFRLDGRSDVRTGAFVVGGAGGEIVITAGHYISLENTTGGLQTIQAFGGDIVLTTGPGGAFIENAAFPGAISTTDDIILSTDNVEIFSGGLNTSGIGSVTIRPVTPGLLIDLGSAAILLPGTLALTDAEFDLLFTLNVVVGSADSGNVAFSAPLSPFIVDNLTVQGGNDILFNSSLVLPGTLTLRAGDDLHIGPAASFTSSGGGFTAFVDDAQNDGGTGGLGHLDGVLTVATTIHLNGNLDADTLRGSAAADILMGNGGDDILQGFGGADVLDGSTGADQMTGGLGDDDFVVDNPGDVVTEAVGEGNDTVKSSISLVLADNVENLTLTGLANLNGSGNSLGNVISGNAGNNTLNGKVGADTMKGGTGNDIYVVDNVGDIVAEFVGQGTDLVQASATFTIANNIENLTLTGVGNINGTGNGLANTLLGNGGNNTLNGMTGADTMTGGLGNDIYVVDNAGDVVTEAGAAGTDTVQSSITFTLGANLENLTLTGGASIDGTGNTVANILTGNGAANTLTGLGGNDTLDGGGGADTMIGGLGNDSYVVNNVGDVVTEAAAAGTDTVQSSVTFTLGANVENLTLTGVAVVNGTGNTLANILTGNGAANTLNGGTGIDTMSGDFGNDIYVVDNAGDVVTEAGAAGTDTVQSTVTLTLAANLENLTLTGGGAIDGTGNTLANTLLGNAVNNILTGLAGNDQLTGNSGNDNLFGGAGNDDLNGGVGIDKFRFDAALNAATNVDDIAGYSVADDSIFLDRDIFTGFAANGVVAASAFVNGTAAGDANDRIIYDSATGNIFYDADGNAAVAQILFATVAAGTALTNADFLTYI